MNTTKKLQQAKLDQWAVLCKEQSQSGLTPVIINVFPVNNDIICLLLSLHNLKSFYQRLSSCSSYE